LSKSDSRFLLLLAVAALNDAVDLLAILNPVVETLLDILTAILICIILGEINPWLFLTTILDAVPGVDFAPIWTLYVIYRYISKKAKTYKVKVE